MYRIPRLRVVACAGVLTAAAIATVSAVAVPGAANAATVHATAAKRGTTRTADTVDSTAGTTPVSTSALSFIDSVGVNVHTYYSDTTYANQAKTLSLLQNLGVRTVRDGLAPNRPDEVAALQQLAQAGIRPELILSGTGTGSSLGVDPAQLSELDQLAGSVDAVEPTNEYDCSGDSNWTTDLRHYSTALVKALQATPATRQLGVLGPSYCQPGSVDTYGSIAGTASVVNAHDYSGGQAPELSLEARLPQWQQTEAAGLPVVVTETGFQNAIKASGYAGQTAVTESTAADYTIRTLLDDSRLGIARTYLYELEDEKADPSLTNPEEHYGLVRSDGTVKPAYTAVKNLLADLAQGAPSAVTSAAAAPSTPVSLAGGGSLLRSLVVSDSSDAGETVALWLAAPLEDTTTHTALASPTANVSVSLGAAMAATSQQPAHGNAVKSLGMADTFTVPVTGAVTLVHLAAPVTTSRVQTVSCTSRPGYETLSGQLGASAADDLSSGWSATPGVATSLPQGVASGVRIAADGEQQHLNVSGTPKAWTISVWERTDAGSANFAQFLHVTGANGALMRTYDLTDDVPSHMELSAYGAPAAGSGYGTETWGQAQAGTWHLLSLTASGSKTTFAVDGVPAGTVASGALPLTGVDVGSLSAGFRGALAGLAVFPKALTGAQLVQLATTAPISC